MEFRGSEILMNLHRMILRNRSRKELPLKGRLFLFLFIKPMSWGNVEIDCISWVKVVK